MLTDFVTGPVFQETKSLLTTAFNEAMGEDESSTAKKQPTSGKVRVVAVQHTDKHSEDSSNEESHTAHPSQNRASS